MRISYMTELILNELRNQVDSTYVGFSPNGRAKPVHIANGAQRSIFGAYYTDDYIKRLALVSNEKGEIPRHHELKDIWDDLTGKHELDIDVGQKDFEHMREIMQEMLSSDKGAYVILKEHSRDLDDTMISYTTASKFFLTKRTMHQDGGEFIGGLICEFCNELKEHIYNILNNADDPITYLFRPILKQDDVFTQFNKDYRHNTVDLFKQNNENRYLRWYIEGLQRSSLCLLKNFKKYKNSLNKLRLFNLFCILHLIRYLVLLESFYCDETAHPMLLDFSHLSPAKSPIAKESQMSYINTSKSLNRFYAWAYSNVLGDEYTIDQLISSPTPIYSSGKQPKNQDGLENIWNMAKEKARGLASENGLRVFGEAIYDMLALEATNHPVNYIRSLGVESGMLYPPDSQHPHKRFIFSTDMLEVIVNSTVNPEETLNSGQLRQRIFELFGFLCGPGTDVNNISSDSMLPKLSEDELKKNFENFALVLEGMDFAKTMADGIFQVRAG